MVKGIKKYGHKYQYLTYFLSGYDQLLLYKNVGMLNSPITGYDNLTYQEKSDIQEKIRAKMSIYNK